MLSAAEEDFVLKIVSEVLRPESDTSGSDEVKAVGTDFTDDRDARLARKKATLWEVPPAPDAAQDMPGYNTHFLSSPYEDCLLYEMCGHTAFSTWSPVWRNQLNSTDPKVFLAHKCSGLGLLVQSSRVCGGKAENGVLFRKKFE